MDDRYQNMDDLVQDLKSCIKDPEGTGPADTPAQDVEGKTMIFSHSQVAQIEKEMNRKKKKEKSSGKQKTAQRAEEPIPVKKKKKKKKKDTYREKERAYDAYDDEDDENAEPEVAAGLQKALNIGLVIVILIVILFVLEFVFSALGMFKGITQYLPSVDHFGEWLGRVSEKLNSMNIGKYLGDGFKRILEIFKR